MNRKVPILITTYRNSLHHLLNIAVLVDKMDKTNITKKKKRTNQKQRTQKEQNKTTNKK